MNGATGSEYPTVTDAAVGVRDRAVFWRGVV